MIGSEALAQATSKAEGEKTCADCHDAVKHSAGTRHMIKGDPRSPAGKGQECNACHGDTGAHLKTPRKPGLVPVVFGRKGDVTKQNEQCLSCHDNGTRIHWEGSGHQRTQLACASCHQVHAPKDPVMVPETQVSVCASCHKDRRAEMLRMSAHPLKTGFFSCSSCHAPHGSAGPALLKENSVNETCFGCHAETRGPFLWEHPSAKDSCLNCHHAHGSNTAPMLKVRPPFLCQQCHQNRFHPSTAYDGSNLPPSTSGDKMLGKACTNCHVKVHGSNHPSGARLQR